LTRVYASTEAQYKCKVISDLDYAADGHYQKAACFDYGYWETLKRRAVYFVTEEKSNSAARQISTDITDRSDPRNEGVASDYYVGRDNGPQLRRVVYRDPRDGTARKPHLKNREGETMKSGENFINQAVKRATQRTHRFIRWLRVALYREVPWREAVARLAVIWGSKC